MILKSGWLPFQGRNHQGRNTTSGFCLKSSTLFFCVSFEAGWPRQGVPKPQHTGIKVREEICKGSNLKGCRHKRFPGAQIAEQWKKLCFYSRHTMLNRWVSSRGPCTQGEGDYNSEEKIHQGQEIQTLRRLSGLWLAPFVWCLFKRHPSNAYKAS